MFRPGSAWRAVFWVVLLQWDLTAGRALSPGDIAIVGFNFDNPDEFGFVVLVDLESGTEIFFTDSGVTREGNFRGGEGAVKYTAPGEGVPAGTVIIYSSSHVNFVPANDSNVGTSGLALSSSGDQIIAFQGSSNSPTFLYALNSEGVGWQSDASNSNETTLPPGLTGGTSAVALDEADNGYYNGITAGSRSELLEVIPRTDNWTTSDSRMDSGAWPAFFTVYSPSSSGTTVQFDPQGDTISEGRSSYPVTVSIVNESPSDETLVDVVLTETGTASNGLDISYYSTQTVTFPADSSDPQAVTIFLLDDAEFEGSETLVFELQNAQGGEEASVGQPARFTLTIEDNDPSPIVINEIHYNPSSDQGPDAGYEFLELYNRSESTAYLQGYTFRQGIDLGFRGTDSLVPGSFLVLAKDSTTYPGSLQWTAGGLTNSGEALVVVTQGGTVVDSVTYAAADPWPARANGRGPSLELVDPFLDNSLAESWQASFVDGGTPGRSNSQNSVPKAMPDSFAVQEDQVLIVDPPGVLSNDSDPDGHALTAFLVQIPSHGELVLSMDGGFEYAPDSGFFGSDHFLYAAHDGMDTSSSAAVSLAVMPVNDLAFPGRKTIPTAFGLYAGIPNPFNPVTRIEYHVPRMANVGIEVYDLLGRPVRLLASGVHEPGAYAKRFRGVNDKGLPVGSGIYLCRMVAFEVGTEKVLFQKTQKLVLLK